jgi:hypothetical protein
MAYKFGTKVSYDNGVFEIIQIVLKRFDMGEYQHYNIHYDPRGDMPSESIEIDERMKLAVLGDETWYDDEYIKGVSWYTPGELESEIKRCTDGDYLNMMASGLSCFRDVATVSELIIQNAYCDKGTALLLYWRLLSFYFERGFLPEETETEIPVVSKIRDSFLAGAFSNGIAYAPLKDKANAKLLKKQKAKWKIPEYMKRSV